ncbi:hypothetical protein [Xanthomonas campestris]
MSGTGSVVAEQLLRMGVGELIGIDDDHVEEKISTESSTPRRSMRLRRA